MFTTVGSGRCVLVIAAVSAYVFPADKAQGQTPQPLSCFAQAAGTPYIRAEGKTELVGDIIITCFGGSPAGANENLRQISFQVFTQPTIAITSRPLASATTGNFVEAMLAIDDPRPNSQVLCGSSQYPYSVPVGSGLPVTPGVCGAHSGTGNGLGSYDPATAPNPVPYTDGNGTIVQGTTYRGNMYAARQVSPNLLVWEGVPFDPPGLRGRLIRITNVRVDASQLGVTPGADVPVRLFVSTSASGLASPIALPIGDPIPTVATASASIGYGTPDNPLTCGTGPCACTDASNPPVVTGFKIRVQETVFPSAWRRRTDARPVGSTDAPAPIPQDSLGVIYQTESGVYKPSFPGVYANAGLADYGTRVLVRFKNTPSGVELLTPAVVSSGTEIWRRVVTDANGAGAYTAAAADANGNVAAVQRNGGLEAMYEVIETDTTAFGIVDLPVTVRYTAGGVPLSGMRYEVDYASGGSASVPRFVSTASEKTLAAAPCDSTVPPPPSSAGLYFVPVKPCRLVDTREIFPAGLGKPALASGVSRDFALPSASCGLPATARAYSLNATVVPQAPLGYLTSWPTGASQPFVSTLNSIDARVKANAAIIPAGTAGAVSFFATNPTELVVDVNGYFVDAAANPQALAFYPLPPCRIADTRNPDGSLGGPIIGSGTSRNFPVLSSNCGVPASAKAYSLNATVVPRGALGYLTLWPTGDAQPFVSTLNSIKGDIVANAAIVPAGTNGSISAFAQGDTHLVLDINGYFAPPGRAGALRYFAIRPCRLFDTREPQASPSPFKASEVRNFDPITSANCGIAANVAAYALNATVVPPAGRALSYMTLWPNGQAQPFVSTLNVVSDPIVANAAIVPAGTSRAFSIYTTDPTHLVVDINGFFAP